MMKVDKQLVREQFKRAADSYNDQAMIQYRVADHLLDMVEYRCRKQSTRVLEIGCCTGLLTGKLVQRCGAINELVLNDLVEGFTHRVGKRISGPTITTLAGDIERVHLPGPFELIISSSTFHWLHDLSALFRKLAHSLTPGGTLAFSIYGPDNLKEIRELTGIGLDYATLAEVESMLNRHLVVDDRDEQHQIFHFDDPLQVLNHLRGTGVNAVDRTPWTREQLQRFCNQYQERFSSDRGVRLTYHPLYLVAHRPPLP